MMTCQACHRSDCRDVADQPCIASARGEGRPHAALSTRMPRSGKARSRAACKPPGAGSEEVNGKHYGDIRGKGRAPDDSQVRGRRSRQLELGGRTGERNDHPHPHPRLRLQGPHPPRSADEPQYEIKSDKTDHVAAHKGTALRKIGD